MATVGRNAKFYFESCYGKYLTKQYQHYLEDVQSIVRLVGDLAYLPPRILDEMQLGFGFRKSGVGMSICESVTIYHEMNHAPMTGTSSISGSAGWCMEKKRWSKVQVTVVNSSTLKQMAG